MSSVAEWLEQNLQRRGGGQELPYSADVKWTVRQHLLDLVAAFPTLALKVENYTHTDGTVVPLFVAEGTLPMFYQGVKYNIPVAVWLPEKYPRTPPIMYVVPTQDMMIKPRHSFVTPSGVVNSAYVRNWKFPSSNLEVMGHDTSIHFGQEPPLFQKPPDYVPQPVSPKQHPNPSAQAAHSDTFHNPIRSNDPYAGSYGGSSGTHGSLLWGGAVSAAAGNSRPVTPPPTAKPPGPDLTEIFRKAAVKAVSGRLTAAIAAANAQTAKETDELFQEQTELGHRQRELDNGIQALQAERSALETCILELAGKRAALERWLTENESKTPQGNVEADEAIVPADVLSRQALDAQAEDLALEDALYSLDKALQDGVVTPDVYLKQVRNLCYKQFFVRALGTKVAQRQHELRRNAVASRPSQHHVQIPQGDHWSNTGILANPLASRQ